MVHRSGRRRQRAFWFFIPIAVPVVAAVSVFALVSRDDQTWPADIKAFPSQAVGVTDSGPVPFDLVPPLASTLVTAWTGEEALLFTGVAADGVSGNAGARLDPSSATWSVLPAAPFDHRLAFVDGVWTGSGFLIGGVSCDNRSDPHAEELHCFPGTVDFAIFNPDDASWNRLPTLPVLQEPGSTCVARDRTAMLGRDSVKRREPRAGRTTTTDTYRNRRTSSAAVQTATGPRRRGSRPGHLHS